jgi:hypothetical protein
VLNKLKKEISMSKHNILFVRLDTHKVFVEVAYIEDQRGALGRQPTSKVAIKNIARQFESKYSIDSRIDRVKSVDLPAVFILFK